MSKDQVLWVFTDCKGIFFIKHYGNQGLYVYEAKLISEIGKNTKQGAIADQVSTTYQVT